MNSPELSRRDLLKAGAASALLIGFQFTPGGRLRAAAMPATAVPNAFVRIGSDDSVTVLSKHLEMGQGTYTGLATILAEELDADWQTVRVEGAPANAAVYNNLNWGPIQGTGGSSAMANSWMQLRQAGASARALLVAAAAKDWGVPAAEISVKAGVVTHAPSGRKARFGELVATASTLQAPKEVKLKDPKDFTLVGKQKLSRRDSADKVNGKAVFTQDINLPGMLTAVVAHPPRFGAKLRGVDASAAKAVKGVVDVVTIESGVAVLAKGFWAAKKGRDALKLDWDESGAIQQGSSELRDEYTALLKQPGAVANLQGEPDAAFAKAAKVVRAVYEFPYLAHAAMEPLNCVISLGKEGVEVWNGEQFHTFDQGAIAAVFGLKPEQVKINTLYAGGSFGRRANPASDFVIECARIVKAIGGKAPVKMVWTREDDMRGGYYRPMYLHEAEAALDAQGKLIGWRQRIVGQSIITGTAFEGFMVKNGVDATSVEGAANLPYHVPNLRVDLHSPKKAVPVLWWRSVGHTHTGFAVETLIDEAALAAKADPVAFRLALLDKHPRHAGVLKLVADKAGWSKPLKPGKKGEKRGRGVAVVESFGTFVAQVAEVTVKADGSFRIDRVVCAVDCGTAINPDVIRAQMEGGIGFGLSAALHSAITLKGGQVEQSNFHDYPMLRINEMPRIEVHILPSGAAPTGVGEPGVPPIAPAVANALAAATGKRLSTLPLKLA
ncbi:xanthine dehydrogenase family protein molybdopterin-binding subunit [Chitinimonas sp. BJYL2]|uniref:xanthine dehydrogenase family protein molybdopterin-binding subunit n=1 Tax=Chitinimonas sp. BJYL2 TaxID=2976696 RepID=UPI0022B46524|nr:xanthine dehydrogenase family protein molybdopterin-binding subunit [Chitinimonas sp. BJYL2]